MTTPRRPTVLLSCLALAGAALGGCVAQDRYDDAELSARSLAARNQELLQENESMASMIEAKDARIASLQNDRSRLESRVSTLNMEVDQLRNDFSSLDERLGAVRLGGINAATDRELRRLAERHPELIRYNPERGMLEFGSDLTFDSGSDQVKAAAAQSLAQLGRILQNVAGEYDIRIVGHTDSQRPGTSAARHPTNRHLAAHRSIAVARELEKAGVPGARIEISGWGEFRPVVMNNSRGGTPANRRVEIFLLPSSATTAFGSPGESAPANQNERPRQTATPMK